MANDIMNPKELAAALAKLEVGQTIDYREPGRDKIEYRAGLWGYHSRTVRGDGSASNWSYEAKPVAAVAQAQGGQGKR